MDLELISINQNFIFKSALFETQLTLKTKAGLEFNAAVSEQVAEHLMSLSSAPQENPAQLELDFGDYRKEEDGLQEDAYYPAEVEEALSLATTEGPGLVPYAPKRVAARYQPELEVVADEDGIPQF